MNLPRAKAKVKVEANSCLALEFSKSYCHLTTGLFDYLSVFVSWWLNSYLFFMTFLSPTDRTFSCKVLRIIVGYDC